MIGGVIVDWLVALLCVGMGLLIWKKQKISLLHDYHYRNVKKEDVPAYARLMGIGLVLIGIGVFLTGLFMLLEIPFWWSPLVFGLAIGFVICHVAQTKYNGSWFS